MVVGPGMTERKQRRCLTDRARPKARTRAELRAHVIGDAENGDLRIDPVPVRADRALAEGAVADEGKIEAAGVVGVLRHHPCGFQTGRLEVGVSAADRRAAWCKCRFAARIWLALMPPMLPSGMRILRVLSSPEQSCVVPI